MESNQPEEGRARDGRYPTDRIAVEMLALGFRGATYNRLAVLELRTGRSGKTGRKTDGNRSNDGHGQQTAPVASPEPAILGKYHLRLAIFPNLVEIIARGEDGPVSRMAPNNVGLHFLEHGCTGPDHSRGGGKRASGGSRS